MDGADRTKDNKERTPLRSEGGAVSSVRKDPGTSERRDPVKPAYRKPDAAEAGRLHEAPDGRARILLFSPAKINLSIDVGAAGEDGYHSVDMILQALAFHDGVTVERTPGMGGPDRPDVTLQSNRSFLPTDSRNLAVRAVSVLADDARAHGLAVPEGTIAITLFKRIPVSAGLAGGSGNAAAVLHALNRIWHLEYPLRELMRVSEKLGSDVPFCTMSIARMNRALPQSLRRDPAAGTCARATGRGTVLTPLRGIRKAVVIAKPRISVSTPEVYRGFDRCDVPARPDNDRLARNLQAGRESYEDFVNVLENYTLQAYPVVAEIKAALKETGAEAVLMSGSGPTVFALYDDLERAIDVSRSLRKKRLESYWTRTVR